LPLGLLRWLWLAALTASLAFGAWSVRGRLAARPRIPFTPLASSDAYLGMLAVAEPARGVRRLLDSLPPGDDLVLMGPVGDPAFIQVLYTVSYLALPRQVAGMYCPPGGGLGQVVVPLDFDQRISGVLFFHAAPPGAAERLGPALALARIAPQQANSGWNSFCSSLPPPSS
jgi:hypothetical protein